MKPNGKKIDGVGDLPKVMRTPYTFNYKLGKENAPLCHIVEDSGLKFDPAQNRREIAAFDSSSIIKSTNNQYGTNKIQKSHRLLDRNQFIGRKKEKP